MPFIRPFHTLVITCLFINLSAFSQPAPRSYYVQHFGEDEGLPQNSINDLLPDDNGFLWIATESGMARFNGNRFLSIQVNAATPHFNFARVKGFYYKGSDTIIGYASANSMVALVVNNRVVAFEKANPHKFGLLFLGRHRPVAAPAYLTSDTAARLRQQWSYSAGSIKGAAYNKDTFAITHNTGVGFYDSKGLVTTIRINKFNPERLVYMNGVPVYIDEAHNIEFYSPSGLQKRTRLPFPSESRKCAIYQNSYGPGFFCVADTVLYHITMNDRGELVSREIISGLHNAADTRIIYEKDTNTIIIGTTANGLYVYKKSLFAVSDLIPKPGNNVFYVQQLMADNETILTGKNKLFRYTRYIGELKQSYTTYDYALLKDKNGYLWYFYRNHLLKARAIGVNADTVFTFNGLPGLLFEDRAGNVWFSSESHFGYFTNGQFHPVRLENCTPLQVTCMAQDASGKYFIGTKSCGLYSLGRTGDAVAKAEIPSLAFDTRYILSEADGKLWVCTYGRGLFLVEKQKITQFPQKDGRFSYVHCIVEEGSGHFWLPTNNGLYLVSRRSLLAYANDHDKIPFYYRFSKKNGLRTNEFNGATTPAYLRLPNGQVSLSSMHGLVQFDPHQVHTDLSVSPVLIESVQLDSSEVPVSALSRIKSSVANIRFSVSSAFWGDRENELVEYKVDGQKGGGHARWFRVDESGIINLFSPSQGNYQLVVRKRTGLGENDFIYRKVNFSVAPKWYQTAAFFIAINIIAILLVLGISYWRRSRDRKTNRILKQRIEEKQMAEEQLRREKELSQSIINSLPGVFFIYDKNRRHLLWNRNLEKVTGYNGEELAAKLAGSCLDPSDLPLFLQAAEQTYITGHAELEVTLLARDGKKLCFYVNEIAITYQGRPAILAIGIDVSLQKKAEQEKDRANYLLNERIKELTTLYEASVILEQDEGDMESILQDFVTVIPAGWQYPEITEARVTMGTLSFSTPGFGKSAHSQEATFYSSGGKKGKIEIAYMQHRPNETEGPFLAEERKLLDMLADLLGIYFTKKEAVAQARLAERKRVEYTQSLEEMLFMTSHEVRKPLANLLGLAELAENPRVSGEDLKQLYGHVKHMATELDEFTRKLTAFIYHIKSKHANEDE